MRFFAHINPKSAIHKQWRAGNRISGLLDGALFRWNPVKRVFEAAELPDEAIDKFRARQDQAVILETLRVLPEEQQQDVLTEQQGVGPLDEQQVNEPVLEQQDAVAEPQQVDDLGPKTPPRRRVLPE